MKTKYLTSLFFGLILLNTACEEVDKNELYQEKFHKVLYLKNTGIVDVTLYLTGTNAEYGHSVIKGGSETTLTADANLSSMTQAELDEYCVPRGLFLKSLPANCFELNQTSVHLESTDVYKVAGMTLNTEAINKVMIAEEGTEFVIPVKLTSETDSINSEKNLVILRPHIVTPMVSFRETGYVQGFSPKEGRTFEIPITLQINNQWDFDCEVEVDPSILDGTSHNLLPEGSYKLENGGVATFKAGVNTAILKLTVDPLTEADYVLPIRLKNISNKLFDMSQAPILFGVTINKYPLTEEMLSTNAQEPSEGPIKNLLDGDITTYFHSQWSGTATADKHYVQVALPVNQTSFKFSYTNRSANGNVALADFDVSVSTDGTNFVLLKNYTTAADKLPTGAAGVFNSYLLKSSTPFSYIRFTCNKSMTNTKYFVWSEFSLFGL